ncbi:Repeat domain-containing protein [Ohtaekwangia koreensis]|uniref:Repeat domain-containing protein n=2 Tax=Ohtaekwangia koreensis TaxID=688867 RepID=A0A1T5JGU8_9BACT|nr:Repeat domain-containing protein [Ohtaekwangia koreensis]
MYFFRMTILLSSYIAKNFKRCNFLVAFLAGVLVSCTSEEEKPLMELLPPEYTGIDFVNQLYEDENLNIITFEYFYNGAGIGIADINNDGLKDIFFAANMSTNRLYLNKGELKFEDITQQANLGKLNKWATGVSIIDINQDGWLDIYVCYAGPFQKPELLANELYINNHDNTFTESAHAFGLDDARHSVQAAFFDYDRDGDLDVYILTNTTDETGPNVIRPKRIHGEMMNTDRLYRNNGNNTFTNISAAAGITKEGYGLGVSIADINQDEWPDIVVSNDYLSNDLLYINNQDGTFTDRAGEYFKHTSYSAMGNDVADYNNDGLPDFIEVDMLPHDNKRQKLMFGATNYDRYRSEIAYGYTPQYMRNTLQLNVGKDPSGQPAFSEIAQLAGIEATDWSWSPLFVDIDNDGWKDLLITNGYPRDITNRDFVSYRMQEFMQAGYDQSVKKKLLKAINSIEGAHLPVFAFKNKRDLTFSNQSIAWGFTMPCYSTGAAYADLDNDGDLDYITNNIDGPAFVFESHADSYFKNHFLRIDLQGPPGNNHGYGTKLILFSKKDSIQYHEHYPYRGYQSTVEQEIHFGLGKTSRVDSLLVLWPDGKRQLIKSIPADQVLVVQYTDAGELKLPLAKMYSADADTMQSLFNSAAEKRNIAYRHKETEYADFKIEPLLPHKYSEDGPGIAVADVNGDGLDDFFVGGAYKQWGQLSVQTKDGKFISNPLTSGVKLEEDMGTLFFDADNDADADLYIVSGGNEFAAGSPYYQDRLYLNDGKGNFKLDATALPSMQASGSCVLSSDYDKDGDLDLFVGGRLTPHQYPKPGQSYILRNDKGHFTDVTDQVAPGLKNIGMVTSALWTDIDNDQAMDLIVVGEWMPVTIFKNTNGFFKSTILASSTGWWNSIEGGDFDEDGDTDYILGNLGLNSRYKTSSAQPARVYTSDFNDDGVEEALLSYYIEDVNRPAHPRDDLFLQVASFKKYYPSYQKYAEQTMDSVLVKSKHKPVVNEAQTFYTSYLENRGKAEWQLKPLPAQAQVAPVYGIVTGDYNNDGHADAILSGNSYAPDVLTGRYDAMKGIVMQGEGNVKGNLTSLKIHQSGVLIDGAGKSLAKLITADAKMLLLATQNNDSLRVFEGKSNVRNVISLRYDDIYALVTSKQGKKMKIEFYYGSGYLSQSSRKFSIPENAKRVQIINARGQSRELLP